MSRTKRSIASRVAWLPVTALALSMLAAAPAAASTPGVFPPASSATSVASIPIGTAASTSGSAFAADLENRYIDPDRVYSTDVRWWLGSASHTDEVLLEQIQALYDAGFRGVELCMQADNAAPTDLYAYGSAMWEHKWNLMMNKLLDLGMSVYLTSGTNWATSNVPGLDPDSQAAMQNLTLGTATVAAGAQLPTLPVPPANARRTGATFVTAYAYRVVEGDAVDADSRIDLPVTQGADVWTQNTAWTAPTDGTYRVFAIWTQGTYQTSSPSAEPSYATNYFDPRGVAALKGFWEEHYLKDPALREKIADGDVQLFMDSLEITVGNSGITWWSEDMAEEFQKRKGYDIMPYIFLMSGLPQVNAVYNAYIDRAKGTYDLAGNTNLREKTINDFLDVLTQLYMERMLTPLKEWLNSVGIETRAQISYGRSFEISEPSMAVDYPEVENYNQYNQVDLFRLHTGGAKLENKVLSSESGAQLPAYNTTYQLHLKDFYSQYAAGIQRMIWHVWAADYGYGNYQWPGYSPRLGNENTRYFPGTRHPGSRDYDEYNAHLGRIQQLLQTGQSRTDVGFIHNNWNQGMAYRAENNGTNPRVSQMNWQLAHQGVFYRSTELQDNGYTYDYFSPKFLFDDDVTFDEQNKTIEKAGYKAVVLYQDWLDIGGAQRILDWAKKGLKVVILDEAATRTPMNDGRDAELKAVVDELKTLPSVRTAQVFDRPSNYFGPEPGGYDDNVLEKLRELGVEPTVGYAEPNLQLLTQTRQDEKGNEYVYVYNYDDGSYLDKSLREEIRNTSLSDRIATDIVKDGEFIPYSIDAWTGKITELTEYRWADGKTIVPIDLAYNNIALLAFEKADEEKLHVTSTNASSAYGVPGGVAVRATQTGSISAELSNGEMFSANVSVPPASDIRGWDLTVKSVRPGATPGDLVRTETIGDLTTVNRKTSTVTTPLTAQLDTLTTWDKIPAIGRAVSGTGTYKATFTWDASKASGAYLDFGDNLAESMRVWINGTKVGGDVSTNPTKVKKDVGGVGKPTIDDGTGTQVPLVGKEQYTGGINWIEPIADVSPYLRDGENSIVIEYSSTLANVQLDRGIITEQFGLRSWWRNDQQYLAFGPEQAKLIPFVDVTYDDQLDVTTTATPKVLGGKVYISVAVTNDDAVPVNVEIQTRYGKKSFLDVAPGKAVTVSLNSRAVSVPAGEATVTVTGVLGGSAVTATSSPQWGAFPSP